MNTIYPNFDYPQRVLPPKGPTFGVPETGEKTYLNFPTGPFVAQSLNYDIPGVQPNPYPMNKSVSVDIDSAPPRDYVVWSLFTFVYGNICCVGLAALIHSIRARDRIRAKDMLSARVNGDTAWRFNVLAICLAVLIIFIIAMIQFNRHA